MLHWFEEFFGERLRPNEKYFYIVLKKLENRYADAEGWFWHKDKRFTTEKGYELGFETFGFSESTSKRIRRKLKKLRLIKKREIYTN